MVSWTDSPACRHHVNAIAGSASRCLISRSTAAARTRVVGIGRHALAKRRQFVAGLALQVRDSGRAKRPPRFSEDLGVERRQPIQQRLTGGPAQAARFRARGVHLSRGPVDQRVECLADAAACPRRGQPQDDALQVRGQRTAGGRLPRFALRTVARPAFVLATAR